MHFDVTDFNGADSYYLAGGKGEWRDLEAIIQAMPLYLQGSQQAGKGGSAIFDPKATNARLGQASRRRGWSVIPVPAELTEFGVDWDGGKNETLAEWQFSNYPFLWNNIIRTEAVFTSKYKLPNMKPVKGIIIVTKSGVFPSSNSTLYYEQARAQIGAVTKLGAFKVPIRLVGLTIPSGVAKYRVSWAIYPSRYSRAATSSRVVNADVKWLGARKYGNLGARFRLP